MIGKKIQKLSCADQATDNPANSYLSSGVELLLLETLIMLYAFNAKRGEKTTAKFH